MKESTEAICLCERLSELSLWLHGYSFYNNLIYNPEFDVLSLIRRACEFGCAGIEINIEYSRVGKVPVIDLSPDEFSHLRRQLNENALEIGIDVSGTEVPKLSKALEISRVLGARFIRCYAKLGGKVQEVMADAVWNLKTFVSSLEKDELLAIENHEFLRGSELAAIRSEVGDKLQFVYDYGNSVPAGESPDETLDILKQNILVAHLKDQVISETDEGLRVVGVCVGEGNLNVKGITKRLLLETPVRIISLQNVRGYSSLFFSDHDEVLKHLESTNSLGRNQELVIDYEQMRLDERYRDEIISTEITAAEKMMREVRALFNEFEKETLELSLYPYKHNH